MHPNLWHPYFQAKTCPEPLKVRSAQGIWLELEDGRHIIDAISSWWVTLYGHGHPRIAAAIYQQAQQLEQVIFSGFTHEPAEQLAEALVKVLPPGLTRVFYSDNGSTSVEVALKMTYQYWVNQGQPRTTFLAFEAGYHGDTFGTMSVGARSLFTQAFTPLLFEVEFLPFPATWLGDETIDQKEAQAIATLQDKLTANPDRYAGVIIEPLIQGAGGMNMGRPQFLQTLAQHLKTAQIPLILDEVMTGFGRTGDWFACTKAQIQPDVVCLSKGLTGGFLPFAATVCTEAIYEGFFSEDPFKTLYHGHSYAGNPLGCAAALAAIALMQEQPEAFQRLEALHLQHLNSLQACPMVEKLRVTGTVAALDIIQPTQGMPTSQSWANSGLDAFGWNASDLDASVADILTHQPSTKTGYLAQVGPFIRQRALELGCLLRPLGNVLYILPPYCISEAELAQVYGIIQQILNECR
ncbi:MAG: adenosylmethionine--8-amino-7-oxononanoate transaminase [Synechococcales bacterium]|nr:adenosylmethionine--8-amino-7-oxononanoate transaminase [Synechococcales bacterium]